MSPLQFLRDDFKAITYCKWKGHTISEETLDRIRKDDVDEVDAECMYCKWPVVVRKDPDNPGYWLVSED